MRINKRSKFVAIALTFAMALPMMSYAAGASGYTSDEGIKASLHKLMVI